MDGARWVQETVLEGHTDPDLRVYAIWFSMYPGDVRERWPAADLPDPRVIHYWDEHKVAGTWYAGRVGEIHEQRAEGSRGHEGPVLWDAYLVYGPEARWEDAPDGLRRWGRTILGTRESLREALDSLRREAAVR